jgi:hypothetical protein
MWPMSAAVTRTAGNHTNGGYVTKVFNRSGPNHPKIGLETMATVTTFSRRANPSTFQAATTQRGTRPRASHHPSTPALIPVTMS